MLAAEPLKSLVEHGYTVLPYGNSIGSDLIDKVKNFAKSGKRDEWSRIIARNREQEALQGVPVISTVSTSHPCNL